MGALLVSVAVTSACETPVDSGAVENRPIPCTEGTPLCVERVQIASGGFLPVHSTHSLTDGDPDVTRLIVVVHGTGRNGHDYFERAVAAAIAEGLEDETLVVAPTFQTVDDEPRSDEPYWTSGGWKRGHLSSSDASAPRVSSYSAIDRILTDVMNPTRFPALAAIVVTGHSAGGQVAHRFAATSRVENGASGIDFRYVVANPSTFLYLGPERDAANGFGLPDVGSCPDYNEWHYGLEELNSYATAVSVDSIRAQLVRRDVRILLGDADSLATSLDVTCGANLQGRYRFERGRTLVRYMEGLFPGHGHEEMIVPGVGHSSSRMYLSAVGRMALFGG